MKKTGGFLIIETHGFFFTASIHMTIPSRLEFIGTIVTIGICNMSQRSWNQSNSLGFFYPNMLENWNCSHPLPQIDHAIPLDVRGDYFLIGQGYELELAIPLHDAKSLLWSGALDSDSVFYVWWIWSISVNIQAGFMDEMNPKHILPIQSHAELR